MRRKSIGQQPARALRAARRLAAVLVLALLLAPPGAAAQEQSAVAADSTGGEDRPSATPEPAPATPPEVAESDEATRVAPGLDDDPLLYEDDFFGDIPSGYPDPVERVNRGVLVLNETVDRFVLDPITVAYQWVFPLPVRRGIRNVFRNLNAPSILANDVLQLEWRDAGVTLGRFVVNSSVGVAGIFDVASRMGLEHHDSDFGQTLRLAEIGSGPYLVIPILGPSTLRDAGGVVIDAFLDPTTYVFGLFGLGLTQQMVSEATPLAEQILLSGGSGLSTRSTHYESLKALKESSVDFYSALRSAYYQNREAEIWHRRRHRREDWQTPY